MHKPFSLTDLEEKVNEWAGREVGDATAMPMSMPMTGQGQLSNAAVASLTRSASADDLNVCCEALAPLCTSAVCIRCAVRNSHHGALQGAQVGGLQALLSNMRGVQGSEGQYYAHRQMSTQARALVYENDSVALRLLVDLLQRQGVYVMPAPTPQDFAQSLARDSYDIIFFSALPLSSQVTAALKNTRYCRR
jgi:hypothetical protein